MYRKTYAMVNCDTLKNNIKEIASKYKYKYYFGVVKANAYGHGDYVVNSLIEGGINYLAASSLEECLSLRERNAIIPILCLEPINHEYLNICAENNITITIPDLDYFKKIKTDNILTVHLKVDSGMNRLGFKDKYEILRVYKEIKKDDNLFLEGVYTHFATSGIWDKHWDAQLDNFKKLTSLLDLNKIPIVHLGRSLTLVNHPKIEFANGIRLGIIMFGFAQNMVMPKGLRLIKRKFVLKMNKISPTTTSNDLRIKTAFTLNTEVMAIKQVRAGEFVGYGAKYVAHRDMLLGVLPIGFADGFSKNNEGRCVKINNKPYKIIGEIGMDMITVKIDSTVKLGDKVVLYDNIKTVCRELGMGAYGLFTGISNRVPRIYKEKDKQTEVKY